MNRDEFAKQERRVFYELKIVIDLERSRQVVEIKKAYQNTFKKKAIHLKNTLDMISERSRRDSVILGLFDKTRNSSMNQKIQ